MGLCLPRRAPFNSEGQFTKLNSCNEERSVFNKGVAHLTGVAPENRTGVICGLRVNSRLDPISSLMCFSLFNEVYCYE